MNLYWFSDNDGDLFDIVYAESEERAWELLAEAVAITRAEADDSRDEITFLVDDIKQDVVLSATTKLTAKEGVVAHIYGDRTEFYTRVETGKKEVNETFW